ncbi:MAG TPA: hypothetical protein PKY35_03215 [Candidatus Hydrogenedentes bacterium]|nr:hypothetical protein [Candidatus Hydrogenedentota bacterium]HOL76013.1 hypothetical protein [Candidatus Hydrogenedentota bacterium]HPO84627.1 hypothetical protein [Candidatus Hydrogenedentota bacterium]
MKTRPVTLSSVLCVFLCWMPVFFFPFLALLAEAHLQLRVFHTDYRTAILNNEIQQLTQQIKDLRAREAELQAIRRLEAMAPELGLVAPAHDQIILVEVPASQIPGVQNVTFAQLASPLEILPIPSVSTDERVTSP